MTVTKKENFEAVRAILINANADQVLIDFINHELELLAKKSAARKPSKSQKLSANIADILLEVLASAEYPLSIAELQQKDTRLINFNNEEITPSRISSILNKFIAESATFNGQEKVKKIIIKRKTYYAVPDMINNKRPE